jgi:hypothetical protein
MAMTSTTAPVSNVLIFGKYVDAPRRQLVLPVRVRVRIAVVGVKV